MTNVNLREKWRREAEFFDEKARGEDISIDPRVFERYSRSSLRGWFSKEHRVATLGELKGRRILDVGCGSGSNAVLLAYLGAEVTGFDISPEAIELAKKRADRHAVSGRTSFVCTAMETADFPSDFFDVIWIDAFLHHVLHDLENTLRSLRSWARPGGIVVIGEPVALSPALRRLRLSLPISVDATPDERPLNVEEIHTIKRVFPTLKVRYFNGFARLNRFVLPDHSLERASPLRRTLATTLAAADRVLLSLPGVRRLAGTAAMAAVVERSSGE